MLDDEKIIVHTTCSIGEAEVFSHMTGLVSPEYLTMFGGAQKHSRNIVCRILFVNTYGPQASGIGLRRTS